MIIDINDNGDMVGVGGEERFDISTAFVLRRVGRLPGGAAAGSGVAAFAPRATAVAAGLRPHDPPALQRMLAERLLSQPRKDRALRGRDSRSS